MSRSSFPESVDSFIELFDLPFNKIVSANRLTELKGKATLTNDEQNELLILTTELKDFMITPETFNKFQDALVAVQKFFYDNVQGFIEEKQIIWNEYIREFKYIGKWTTGISYKFQNMVTDSKGDLYICKQTHTSATASNPTTNATYWQKASAKGDKGDIGLNAIYRGDYSASATYALGDAVCVGRVGSASGLTYIALQASTGKSPSTYPEYWTLYSQLYVGSERPVGAGAGLHFIQEV